MHKSDYAKQNKNSKIGLDFLSDFATLSYRLEIGLRREKMFFGNACLLVERRRLTIMLGEQHMLFSGIPFDSGGVYGGLSNQKELVVACPEEFKTNDNPWREFARKVRSEGAVLKDWRWSKKKEALKQILYFKTLLKNTGGLSDDQVLSLGGWMLSEMLTEVPVEHIPAPPSQPSSKSRPHPRI